MSDVVTSGAAVAPSAAPAADTSVELDGLDGSEGDEATDAAPQLGADGKPVAKKEGAGEKALKSWKYKVFGKETEINEDYLIKNADDILKRAQMSDAAQIRMQEAAQLRKDAEQFINILKSDPAKVLSQLGVDPEEFAKGVINKRIEDMQKSPEQLEREKLAQELEQYKKEKQDMEKQYKDAEFQRLSEKAAVELEGEMLEAIQDSKLPKNPYVVKRMADYMLLALQNNIKLSPKDVLPLVRQEITNDIQELFGSSPDEVIDEFLGKDNISKIRKRHLAKVRKAVETASSVKPTAAAAKAAQAAKEATPEKKISMKDFLKGNF